MILTNWEDKWSRKGWIGKIPPESYILHFSRISLILSGIYWSHIRILDKISRLNLLISLNHCNRALSTWGFPPPSLPVVKKPWCQSGLKFPCPLKRHNHEMADCKDFLSMSPEHRWDDIEKYRFCFTCLRPRDTCVGRPCPFQISDLEILVCQPCALNSQSKNLQWNPLNILMCRKKAHAASRAPTEKIHEQFSKYYWYKQQTTGYLIYS